MKSIIEILLVVIALISIVSSATGRAQGDVVGTWDLTIDSPNGKRTATMIIKKEGEKLTGVLKSPRGERPLESVAVNGSGITFVQKAQIQGQDMIFTYKGKVEKGAMKGDVDFGGLATGTWEAVPAKSDAAPAVSATPPTATAPSAASQNITGVWNFVVDTPAGSGTPVFTFKQDGETLTGQYKGQFGEAPLTGTVKGDDIKFTIKVQFQGQDVTIIYSGKIESKDSM